MNFNYSYQVKLNRDWGILSKYFLLDLALRTMLLTIYFLKIKY